MLTSHTVLFLMALLLVAALVEPLAKKIHLPFSGIEIQRVASPKANRMAPKYSGCYQFNLDK